jgi:hypothetical protein
VLRPPTKTGFSRQQKIISAFSALVSHSGSGVVVTVTKEWRGEVRLGVIVVTMVHMGWPALAPAPATLPSWRHTYLHTLGLQARSVQHLSLSPSVHGCHASRSMSAFTPVVRSWWLLICRRRYLGVGWEREGEGRWKMRFFLIHRPAGQHLLSGRAARRRQDQYWMAHYGCALMIGCWWEFISWFDLFVMHATSLLTGPSSSINKPPSSINKPPIIHHHYCKVIN